MLRLDTSLRDLRPLAARILRLQDDPRQADRALHMVTHEIPTGGAQRAYLLNLRGILHAKRGEPKEAETSFLEASLTKPSWFLPFYNKALLYKEQRRFDLMDQALGYALDRDNGNLGALWNLGISKTALGKEEEARGVWGRFGKQVYRTITTIALPVKTKDPFSAERVWVQRIDPARAQILSVVRFGACQLFDTILCDEEPVSPFLDGLVHKETPPREERPKLKYLGTLSSARYTLYIVQGGDALTSQTTDLTSRLREKDLHIEVWSTTMRLPSEAPPRPFLAGLAIQHADDQEKRKEEAAWAARELQGAARSLGLDLFAPALLAAAGDEVGAARHRNGLRRCGSME